MSETNVLGGELQPCGADPVTGFYRDGCCTSGPNAAVHLVCAVVTTEFLEHQRSVGNDLSTQVPAYGFPGLKPGDRVKFFIHPDGTVVMLPLIPASALRGFLKRPGQKPVTIEEMDDAIAAEVGERDARSKRR